jgi:nucleotide-binding universal stress UspA family protein
MSAGRIVVGVDGSAPSRAGWRWAVGQARLTGGTVEAVIAWELPMMLMNHGWAPIYLEEEADFGDDARKRIDAVISEEVVPADSHLVTTRVVHGHPAQVLLDAANRADLLVVGSRAMAASPGHCSAR